MQEELPVTVTPQLRSYWSTCHATHRKVKPACNQICNKNYTDETRHQTQPPQIFEQYFWWCAGFCLPTKELLLLVLSRLDVVFLCIHCMVQNTNQHSFLIHANSVYSICVLFGEAPSWGRKPLALMAFHQTSHKPPQAHPGAPPELRFDTGPSLKLVPHQKILGALGCGV